MSKVLPACLVLLSCILCLNGCASTVTSELKPKSLKEDQPTAKVVVMRGCAKLTQAHCPAGDGKVQTLQLVSTESAWGAIGKGVFMMTPYGWAAMAAHSGKGALVTLPAGRVDLIVEHIQRREFKREYREDKSVRVWYRQWTWNQVITADLKAGEEYVLQLPAADCLIAAEQGEVADRIITSCIAELMHEDQPVPSAGPPLMASLDTTKVTTEETSQEIPEVASGPGEDSMIPERVLKDQQKTMRDILFKRTPK